jgi:PAP2 superfamily/TAT (twin-arginine translocation) pathway signal sequence
MNPVFALALALLIATAAWGLRRRPRRGDHLLRGTGAHYRRLYTRRNFLKLGAAVAGAAGLVYSGADEAVESWHHDRLQSASSDRLADFLHHFGERWWFGIWGAFALVDRFAGSSPLSRWGRQSFHAMAVGLPSLWTVQRGLGGARPKDDTHGPRFVPFADDNAASGHCFIGAIPCLVAARRLGLPAPRTLAYLASPWVGWSRINDHKHYLSQVLLGYGIAWQAVESVESVRLEPKLETPTHDEASDAKSG